MVTTQGHQFSLLDLSRWRDISLPAEGEEEEVVVVVRVHVDSSGWMGWGNGPYFIVIVVLVVFDFLIFIWRGGERGGHLLGQGMGNFVVFKHV